MTKTRINAISQAASGSVSVSNGMLFEPADLADDLRVRQSDFARMCGVSRQTVSMWVKAGKITGIYPDGTFNPKRAAREVIKNTKPACLRAKIFRVAAEDAADLRRRVAMLERELTSQTNRTALVAAAFNTFREMLIERRRLICWNDGARFAQEVAFTEDAAWFEVSQAPSEETDSSAGALPLFDKDSHQSTGGDSGDSGDNLKNTYIHSGLG